mgnify:CR=1 FL=1
MKHAKLLLGVVCLFAFIACGQGEKVEQPTQSDVKQPVEMMKEKAESGAEMMEKKAEGATEMMEEKAEGATEMMEEKAESGAEMMKEKSK